MQVEQFYRLTYFGIMALGASFLTLIWFAKQRESSDHGFGVLALAIWTFVVIDLLKYFAGHSVDFNPKDLTNAIDEVGNTVRYVSLLNNIFFVVSFTYFEEAFKRYRIQYRFLREPKSWTIRVFGAGLIIAVIFSFLSYLNLEQYVEFIDVLISSITLSLLGYAIYKSFQNRGYGPLFGSIVIIVSVLYVATQGLLIFKSFFSQVLPKILILDESIKALVLISHSAIIGLLLSLAVSWVDSRRLNAVLTKRELEVLGFLCESPKMTYQEVADKMEISLETIKTHMNNIRKKLGIQKKEEVIRYVMDNNLVDI